jgi:hypothetical protein
MWDLYTKKEEYEPIHVDEHGRFCFRDSLHRTPDSPSISQFLTEGGFTVEYPDDHPFTVLLTHDVDDIYVKPKHLLYAAWPWNNSRQKKSILPLAYGLLNKRKSPYLNFKEILDLEHKYDAASSFYLLGSPDDIFGHKYTLKELEGEMKTILNAKSEIGFHTGYSIYNDTQAIVREKRQMETIAGCTIRGCRNHVLRFQTPHSWEVLADAGFLYDTTYGYHDMIGFRNGICYPFYPVNRRTMSSIPILELPLVVQDWTLFHHMHLTPADSWNLIESLLHSVERYHGVLTILWHTWTFSYPVSYGGLLGKDWTSLYEKILRYARDHHAWMPTANDLQGFWKTINPSWNQ